MTKEILRKRLAEASAAVHAVQGVRLHDLRDFLDGQLNLNKKGLLKLPLALQAQDVLLDPQDVRGVLTGDWKVLPLLLFIDPEVSEPLSTEAVAAPRKDLEGYELVLLETEDDFRDEGIRLHHALHVYYKYFTDNRMLAYSLRYKGCSLLSLSMRPDKCVHHVVGSTNRPPTPQELEILNHFLTARGATLQYDPNTSY